MAPVTDVSRPRTAAATDAMRERGASTAAGELVKRVKYLPASDLLTVTELLLVASRTDCARIRGKSLFIEF